MFKIGTSQNRFSMPTTIHFIQSLKATEPMTNQHQSFFRILTILLEIKLPFGTINRQKNGICKNLGVITDKLRDKI